MNKVNMQDISESARFPRFDSIEHATATVPNIERHRNEIEKYLVDRGLPTDSFYASIRQYLDLSKSYYRRLLIRDRIAHHVDPKLDMKKPQDQRRVWKEVVRAIGADDATLSRWTNGITDPPLEKLIGYFDHTDCPGQDLPLLDRNSSTRFAIRRALIYIRVFPWEKNPPRTHVPESLSRAWRIIKSHKYYKDHKDLNQHVLDKVIALLPVFAEDVGDIAALRERMEGRPLASDCLYWPFAIFKLATFAKCHRTDPNENPFKWIWHSDAKQIIWDKTNG
jgi:hypothetical protein